ncbi:MAG: type IX secretion system PorP/SprF family membrane protein [Marivirga sp.]|jgi:type IX secretion system PorP/SprF family membrane protein
MKNLIRLLISMFAMAFTTLQAQDPQFSQFYSNPVSLNPALVGIANQSRAVLIHRQQGGKTFGYTTSGFSFDSSFGRGSSGWGIQVINDNQINGIVKSKTYNGSLAHRINFSNESQLGIGIRAGMYTKEISYDQLTFEDQLDSRNGVVSTTNETFGKNKVSNADVSIGMLYSSKNIFAGVNVNHINRPKENFAMDSESKLAMRYTIHAGGFLYSKNYRRQDYVISPNIVYERQGTFNYLNLGTYVATETWTVGAWYRWDDAVIMSLGANFSNFKVGYSYDIPVTKYSSMNYKAHEFTLAYHFQIQKKFKVKNKYKGQCPKFQKYLF